MRGGGYEKEESDEATGSKGEQEDQERGDKGLKDERGKGCKETEAPVNDCWDKMNLAYSLPSPTGTS